MHNAAIPLGTRTAMHQQAFWIGASDGTPLHVLHWHADTPPKAVLMISHGMAEHAARYARLAERLVADGYQVYALDQRGHGVTAEKSMLGLYAEQDGWNKVVGDVASLNHHIRKQHPQAPIFLLGHSMGSYIGQAYLMQHSCSLQGAILSGSNYQPLALYRGAGLIARFERWRLGPTARSKLIDFLSFGSFNKAFKPNRTAFDWLSRDPAEVDKYVTDPLCGFVCTTQLWCDLLDGLQQITPVRNLAQIDSELPLLVIGGDHDPVSNGKRLGHLADALRSAGIKDVELKIYPEARHELLNESNRDEVTNYLHDWLERALARSRSCANPIEEPA
jgi:alpha-beta hydrolase superfamily lysophospholipase